VKAAEGATQTRESAAPSRCMAAHAKQLLSEQPGQTAPQHQSRSLQTRTKNPNPGRRALCLALCQRKVVVRWRKDLTFALPDFRSVCRPTTYDAGGSAPLCGSPTMRYTPRQTTACRAHALPHSERTSRAYPRQGARILHGKSPRGSKRT